MEDDLADVGLNALEAMEAEDEKAESSENEGEKDTSETEEVEDTSNEDAGKEEDDNSEEGDDRGDEPEEEDGSEEEADEADEKEVEEKEEKKELSDEEFEELAKKRGYAKAPSEDEKKKADEEASAKGRLLTRPEEIDEKVWAEMPEANKLVYNALPYLEAEGTDGVVRVKVPDQLPEGFKFKNDRAAMRFQNDLQAQENKATAMYNALEEREKRLKAENSQVEEARAVIGEIEELQKSGELPKPKAKAGTKEFDDDPAVLLINKVLGYREERARSGANLSVKDSFLIYKSLHPEEFAKKEAKGDTERKNIAKKVAGNTKATGTAYNKEDNNKPQYYKVGMTTEDVLDRVLDEMD